LIEQFGPVELIDKSKEYYYDDEEKEVL